MSASSKRTNGSMNVSNLSINVINNVEHVESILEEFFIYHSNFMWDRAREFIEHKRDAFRAAHQSNVSSILASLMNALSQLTLADKNYLLLQFFSTKVFQRKDSVKCSYENLKLEFQRLEDRGSFVGQPKSNSLPQTPHHQSYCHHQSPSQSAYAGAGGPAAESGPLQSEPAQDVLNVEELFTDNDSLVAKTPSPIPPVDTQVIATPTPKSQSFLSKIFRFKTSSNQSSPVNIATNNSLSHDAAHSITSYADELSPDSTPSRSELNCSLESLDRFAAHLSGQLIHYVRVRIEMLDLYEQLSSGCVGKKFCVMDECLALLETIHTNADRNFHHPVLNRLKTMFMFECDILLSLLRVHCYIQEWKFLDSLFCLQDAHNKLNMMANLRDSVLSQLNATTSGTSPFALVGSSRQPTGNPLSPLMPGSALPPSAALRRNFTNSSLSSSGSSNLSVPGPNGSNGTSNHSPNPLSSSSFVYPSQYPSTMYMSASANKRNNQTNMPTMPLLIQWLNKFKLFLMSKYTFYFHSLLIVHLAPASITSSFSASLGASANHNSSANYAQIETQIKSLCTKHLYDFHNRIVNFVKKCDSSYVVLIYDTHTKKDFSLSGYRSPYFKKELPIGINSYPIIYSYPGEFPKNRIPSLIMIMSTPRIQQELNTLDAVAVEHDNKPSNSDERLSGSASSSTVTATSGSGTGTSSLISSSLTASFHYHHQSSTYNNNASNSQQPNATYFLVRPDPDFTLAMICEQKKLDKLDVLITSFMHEMATLLKGAKIFASLKNGNLK